MNATDLLVTVERVLSLGTCVDWCARLDEFGTQGYGATREEAIRDLLDKLAEGA